MEKTVSIIGQGYVGLPLAQAVAASGWNVIGFDVSPVVVAGLNSGKSHIDDLSDTDIATMVEQGYQATSDSALINQSDVVVVCVPTPLGEGGAPDLNYVKSATKTVAENIKPGTLVVLESTTYPGTTEEVCVPILEGYSGLTVGKDLFVAFSPERVDPGSKHFGIKNTPKLVGGITPESTTKAEEFYSAFVDEVVPMSGAKEAETAKLLENTFRHVNIALVNEMAKVCHELDIDIWEVLRGAETKPFGYMKFTPGAGVGGHCIPIDPNYLSYEVRKQLGYPLRFVELAQEINNSMPQYVVSRINEKLNDEKIALNGARILILGVTYKADIKDQRESPAVPIAAELLRRKADVAFHDPNVAQWHLEGDGELVRVSDFDKAVREADIVVLLQKHSVYDFTAIEDAAHVFLDTCGVAQHEANRL